MLLDIYIYKLLPFSQVREEYESNKSLMEKELEELRKNVASMTESKGNKEAENNEIKQKMDELSEQLNTVSEIK